MTVGDGPDAGYPFPIVDFDREATLPRERFDALAERARIALCDPDVRRRASLSRDRRRELDDANAQDAGERSADGNADNGGQRRLTEF